MFSFLSGERKENQSESHKPAWVGPLRPPVSGAWFARKIILRGFSFEKPRREKQETDDGGGRPMACAQIPPR